MIKKLSKYGNSFAILIDKPILELLNINEDTKLKISTNGTNIIIEPVINENKKIFSDQKLQEAHEKVIEKYGPLFEKLSKK